MFNQLNSTEDNSVNFVKRDDVGFSEARYVRRTDKYFIVYLSSQTGCNRGCKFCHLTATGQTAFNDVDYRGYLIQAGQVLDYYSSLGNPAEIVHYNFMARGEALSNKHLLTNAYRILSSLADLAIGDNLTPKFNVSTIMPRNLRGASLSKIFRGITPTIYYSVYGMREDFRKYWLPGALDPNVAFDMLAEYQQDTKKIIKLHWAFIKDENDSVEDLDMLVDAVRSRELKTEVNIVRYNPFSYREGEESPIELITDNARYLSDKLQTKVKIVDRVGYDVKASCGMFVQ